MYFTKIDYKNFKKQQPVSNIIYEFAQSGLKCVQIDDSITRTYKNPTVCARSLNNITHREKKTHIKVSVRGDKVYLVNTLVRD